MSHILELTDTVVTAPANPAMTVDYAKLHLRSLGTSDDLLVANWIEAATNFVEEQTGRQLITATRELWLDQFPGPWTGWVPATQPMWGYPHRIQLPKPPLQSVVSVQYVDGNGVLQDFNDGASPLTLYYQVKAPAGPYASRGWVEPIYGQAWPTTRYESGAVRIQYTCGYGDSMDSIPALLLGVMAFLIGNYDQNRSVEVFRSGFGELPTNVSQTLQPFVLSAYPTHIPRSGILPWGWP